MKKLLWVTAFTAVLCFTFTLAGCSNPAVEPEASVSSSGRASSSRTLTDLEIPLTLEARDEGTIISISNPWTTLIGKLNDSNAVFSVDANNGTKSITLAAGDKLTLYAQGSENVHNNGSTTTMIIRCNRDHRCYLYGNIMSLVTLDNSGSWNPFAVTLTQDYAFTNLFYAEMDPCTGWYSDSLQNHPSKKLSLPATTLTQACYRGMFRNNSGITKTPDLPAPVLVQECYSYMFYDCNNIREIKCLATDISAQYCTEEWVLHVYSGAGTFTKKAGTNWNEGIQGIPLGWDRDNQEYIHWTVIEE